MLDGIVIDPKIHHGVPVVQGTRMPVARIFGAMASGMSKEDLIEQYGLTEQNIRDAMKYAAHIIETERTFPAAV